jgi:hypothetical protein
MAVQKGVQVGCVDSLWGDGNPTGRQGSGLTTPAVGGGNGGNGERVGPGLHPTIVPHLATRRSQRRMPVSAYPPRRTAYGHALRLRRPGNRTGFRRSVAGSVTGHRWHCVDRATTAADRPPNPSQDDSPWAVLRPWQLCGAGTLTYRFEVGCRQVLVRYPLNSSEIAPDLSKRKPCRGRQ